MRTKILMSIIGILLFIVLYGVRSYYLRVYKCVYSNEGKECVESLEKTSKALSSIQLMLEEYDFDLIVNHGDHISLYDNLDGYDYQALVSFPGLPNSWRYVKINDLDAHILDQLIEFGFELGFKHKWKDDCIYIGIESGKDSLLSKFIDGMGFSSPMNIYTRDTGDVGCIDHNHYSFHDFWWRVLGVEYSISNIE